MGHRRGWCHGRSLDRNRLRRATLVPGFRVSRALRRRLGSRSPPGTPPPPGRPAVSCSGAGGRRAGAGTGNGGVRTPGPLASRREERPSPGLLANPSRRNRPATQCGRRCDSGCAEFSSSVQHPHGEGRSEGGDRWESGEGERILRGGTPGGKRGAAKRCAGLMRPSDGGIRGDPTTQAGAPFAPSAADRLGRDRVAPPRALTSRSTPHRHLSGPSTAVAGVPVSPFCRSAMQFTC